MEEWKTVIVNGEIYENYQVSNLGRIKSLGNNKTRKEKILKPVKNRGNYLIVGLCKDGKQKNYLVHRLVVEAFLTKIPGKKFVDHIDGNRSNNVYTNLRWCSQAENNNFDLYRKHNSEARKGKTGELHHSSKAVLCIELNKIYGSTMEAFRELGINNGNISACCNNKRNSAGGYTWQYIELLPCYNEEVNNCDEN